MRLHVCFGKDSAEPASVYNCMFLFFLTAQSATLLKARYTNGVGLTSTDNIEENSEIILDCTYNEFTVDAIRSIELGTDDPGFIYQVL